LRTWDADALRRSIPWLRAKNAAGAAIYIRPHGEHNLSLIDDLKRGAIDHMKAAGFEPTLVVETSPSNLQAWLNHGRRLPKDLSTAVARALAARWGGDKGAADWRHFGRLSGFTNRKAKYQMENGLFPFVRIAEATPGLVYQNADAIVDEVRRRLDREAGAVRTAPAPSNGRATSTCLKTIEDFRNNPVYGGDGNRIDLAYAVYAFSHGVPESDIIADLRSRDLSKKGSPKRQEAYLHRTIAKAIQGVTSGRNQAHLSR
jgi:hypothetical protein